MAVIDDLLAQIKDVSVIPPALITIIGMDDDNELSFAELEKMVESDQILVSRMLKIANSPFFARGNKVFNIRQILTRLGFKTVRSMVAMAMADSIFTGGNYRKFRVEVWQHSVATGVLAQILAPKYQLGEKIDEALIGGLMQDLGKTLLNTVDRQKYIKVLTEYLETKKPITEIEKEHFGVDNVLMGVSACKLWKLPRMVAEPIAHRYHPIEEQGEITRLIGFCDTIARSDGQGLYDDYHAERFEKYCEHYGIASGDAGKFTAAHLKEMKENELYKFCFSL